MSVEDELHWARGHVERLAAGAQREEHTLDALRHMLLAVEELAERVRGLGVPSTPQEVSDEDRVAAERRHEMDHLADSDD